MAFEDQGPEMQHFLDRQTGEVLVLLEDVVDDEEDSESGWRPTRSAFCALIRCLPLSAMRS